MDRSARQGIRVQVLRGLVLNSRLGDVDSPEVEVLLSVRWGNRGFLDLGIVVDREVLTEGF